MNKGLTNPAFDYEQLSKEHAGKLRYYEGELLRSRKRVADEAIKHGEILHGVQQLLADYSKGTFVAWLDSAGISRGTAYNAIDSFVEFASFPNLENLEVSAMYALAKNDKAKKQAMKLADKGVKVTHAMAQRLIADTGKDDRRDAPGKRPQEQDPRPPRSGTDKPGVDIDYGKCPNCAGTQWTEDEDGVACARCHHPHGEPAGDVDADRIATQRAKTIKTCEALMRAFDDLQHLLARSSHNEAIAGCKVLLQMAREWK